MIHSRPNSTARPWRASKRASGNSRMIRRLRIRQRANAALHTRGAIAVVPVADNVDEAVHPAAFLVELGD